MIWFPTLTRFLLATSTKYIKNKYEFICSKCVSSSGFMLFPFVSLWLCECIIKCPYPAWTHLKWLWNAFQKAEICWKALTKGETLNSCELTFQAYCYNDFFQVKMNRDSTWLEKFNNEGNWTIFTLQTRYLVRKVFVFFLDVVFIKAYMSYLWRLELWFGTCITW